MIINHKEYEPGLVHVGMVLFGHPHKNEEKLCHFHEDVTLMKVLIVFYHCNTYLFLRQLQCNKILQVHSSPQYIFKAKGTHHSKIISCKPSGKCIQKQHFLSPKNPGMIIEERMCRIIVFTIEHVYFLGEEENQCRVGKKGGK